MESAGYSRDVRTFFLWEGVTNYLTEGAVDATLRWCALEVDLAVGPKALESFQKEDIMSQDVATLDRELNEMIAKGNAMEGFEKLYANDCVMQENNDEPRTGKDACRQYEMDFLGSVELFHEGTLVGSATSGDRSYSEWIFDVTFKDGGRMRNHQVAARRWADGKVIYEQFFYQPNVKPAG